MLNDFMNKYLDKNSSVLIDDNPRRLLPAAYQSLQAFDMGRHAFRGYQPFAWLLRKPEVEWNDQIRAPFTDHQRASYDRATKRRVWTSQPYFPAHDWTTEDRQSEAEEAEERERFKTVSSEEWENHPRWPEYRQAVIDRVQRRSQQFVDRMVQEGHAKRSLSVEVFGPERSWYFPGDTILIVYRER